MKKFFYMAVAAIAALSSCSSDDAILGEGGNGNNANAPVFTATIEGEAATRTTLVNGTKVYWSNGDKIKINGVEYTTTSTTNEATFAPVSAEATAIQGKYIAVYPSTIALDLATATVTLPATQTYDATTNGIGNVPMAAVSATTELQFKNVCAVLAIKVASGTVKAIKVMADQKNLSGDFILNPLTMGIAASTGSNTVVLECATAVTADNTTFYIAIPPQEYSSLQIYLSADGSTYKEAMATKKAAGLGPLARNKIFPITYKKNAVQLWQDGPYFALFNVGATITDYSEANVVANVLSESDFGDPEGYYEYIYSAEYEEEVANTYKAEYVGGYFTWGGSTTKTNDYYSGSDFDSNNLKPENDTATKLWGSAWRMPTYAEYNYLLAKTTSTWMTGLDGSQYVTGCTMHGRKYEGKDSYSGISVFFPLAGYYDQNESKVQAIDSEGGYWASSNSNDSRSYFLNANNNNTSTSYKDNGYLVRPVLATPAAAPAVTPTPTPTSNLLAGEFSVSADKKVQFTKGNLWCNTTTNPVTYAFETNQYDYPVATDYTSDGTKDGTWLGTHVGHFFWTTAAAASYAQKYDVNAFLTFNGGVNKTSDKFWLDGSDASHKLTVSGTSDLYVLSQAEWTYLLKTRDNASSLYNSSVTVAGKTGCLIIAPDNYTGSIATEYDAAAWATAEAAGLVCLPFAGCRDNDHPFKAGASGDYWTSTAGSDANQAFKICFISEGAYPDTKSSRVNGFPLRLVKTAQ